MLQGHLYKKILDDFDLYYIKSTSLKQTKTAERVVTFCSL